MRLRKRSEWVYRYPVHFCVWDRECRRYGAPKRIYLHFLERSDGTPVIIDFERGE